MKISVYSIVFLIIALVAVAQDLQAIEDIPSLKTVMYVLTAAGLVALAGFLWSKKGLERPALSLRPNLLLAVFFAGMVAIQILWHDLTNDRKIQLLGYVVVATLTYSIIPYQLNKDRRLFHTWLGVCAVVSAALSLTAIASAAGLPNFLGLSFSVKQRDMYQLFGVYATGGITSHPLTLGTEAFFGLCCGFFLWRQRPSPGWLMVTLLNLIGLALSMSRGAWLATAIAAFYWFTPRSLLQPRRFLSILPPLAAAIALFGIYRLATESTVLTQALRLYMGMSNREALWLFGLQAVANKPWAGYGFQSSGDLLTASGLAWRFNLNEDAPFHNTFLDMAIYTGVPLALLYIGLYVVPIITLIAQRPAGNDRQWDLRTLLLCLCLGGVISCFFVNYNIGGLRLPSIMLAIFLGCANWAGTAARSTIPVSNPAPRPIDPPPPTMPNPALP